MGEVLPDGLQPPRVNPAAKRSEAQGLLDDLLALRNDLATVRAELDEAMVGVRGGQAEAPQLEPAAVKSVGGFFPAARVLVDDLKVATAAISKLGAELKGKF